MFKWRTQLWLLICSKIQRQFTYSTNEIYLFNDNLHIQRMKFTYSTNEIYTFNEWNLHIQRMRFTRSTNEIYTFNEWDLHVQRMRFTHSTKCVFYWRWSGKCTIRCFGLWTIAKSLLKENPIYKSWLGGFICLPASRLKFVFWNICLWFFVFILPFCILIWKKQCKGKRKRKKKKKVHRIGFEHLVCSSFYPSGRAGK